MPNSLTIYAAVVCPECPEVVPNVLPKTGQETSYHDGDDGYYEAGWEGDRFTDNGDGTITDNATSLMWPKDATDVGLNMIDRAWADQIAHIEGLTFAGHSDWRMPNLVELQSIIDWTAAAPDLDSTFLNAQEKFPWVSTTTDNTANAFYWAYTTPFWNGLVKSAETVSMCVRDVS